MVADLENKIAFVNQNLEVVDIATAESWKQLSQYYKGQIKGYENAISLIELYIAMETKRPNIFKRLWRCLS